MAVGLPGPAEKAAAVRAMFDRIAARYDRLNVVMTCGLDASWRRAAVLAAALRPGDVVIDLACGTAKLARLAAAAGARAVGVDFAAGMLRAARRSGVRLPLVQADAFTLPLRGGVAAAVTCGFALRNFAAIRPVLAEAGRVLRPGGRLVLLEVATPRNPVLRSMHHVYFHRVMPVLGALLAERAAYDYLPRSTVYLPDPPALRVLLEASGFAGVAIRPLAAGAVQLVTATRDGAR